VDQPAVSLHRPAEILHAIISSITPRHGLIFAALRVGTRDRAVLRPRLLYCDNKAVLSLLDCDNQETLMSLVPDEFRMSGAPAPAGNQGSLFEGAEGVSAAIATIVRALSD
jgi:hypothetical protein